MTFPLSLTFPGPCELALLVFLLLVIPAAILVLIRAATRRPQSPGFPVIAQDAEPDGPGSYRVVGVDKTSRADRELTLEAASRANAQVKAELEGVVVTRVSKVN